ncbi:MAG: MarR family transcriptional regulator [Armatimonadetes bacterium]|nr:MarR family transcriptional regulator [Armatimonadota bacterium]
MEPKIREQAALLECLLPRLMRRLFAIESDHAASELSLAQLRLCGILQSGPRTISHLGEELNLSPSAITQMADRLEKSGMVERVPEQEDRRVKHLRLTPCGTEMMRSRKEKRIRRAALALERLPSDMRGPVMDALQALLEASQPDDVESSESLAG